MDLTFQKNTISYLQALVSQVNTREETTEIVVPDDAPDIGRVISAWAIPTVRSKQSQAGTMRVSGGIRVWVLYAPMDGSDPKSLGAYLPFSMKWELPHGAYDGAVRVTCRMQSVDARMSGARKLLVRATVACLGEVYGQSEAEFYTLPEPPDELEVLQQKLPLTLPAEMAEKTFQLDEVLDIPAGTPAVESIVACQLHPTINDSKVLGEKAVFKGNCALHLVYMTPEGRLAVWDYSLPFSQYTELARHYEQDEATHCIPLLTEIELEPEENGQGLRLRCEMTVQCTVLCRHSLELVTDMYSLHHQLTPQSETIPLRTQLDHQSLRQIAELSFPIHGATMIDCTVLPGFPKVSRPGDSAVIEAPVWCTMMYYDENGALQGRQSRGMSTREIALAAGCPCHVGCQVSGPMQWVPDGSGLTMRVPLELTADSYSDQELTMLRGAVMGEKSLPSADRPSIIVKAMTDEDTLWSLAKTNGSTVDAIRKANRLKPGAPESGALLLIPVL